MKYRQVGLSEDGQTITLKKFHGAFESPSYISADWLSSNVGLLRRGAGVDVETTGLDFQGQKIIEIAIRPFTYRSDNGEMIEVEEGYTGLEDPGMSLTEEIKAITGLTDEMLKGKKIDWQLVGQLIESVDLVIAHNAKFDRPFIDRVVEASRGKLWACSLSQVDWSGKGYDIKKLGILSMFHGFFVDAHRAMNDVNAMINVLSFKDEKTGHTHLHELTHNAQRESVLVYADGSPFESKDRLRENGYRWNTERRCWHRTVYAEELENEIQWLEQNVYQGSFRGNLLKIPAVENFA
jgi:DNA polymerase-3 subunit epsilon